MTISSIPGVAERYADAAGTGPGGPDDRRAELARSIRAYAAQLVSFLLRAVTPA